MHTYDTIEKAQEALRLAEADILADMGEEAVEAGWGDIVRCVTIECTPAVAAELLRMEGVDY